MSLTSDLPQQIAEAENTLAEATKKFNQAQAKVTTLRKRISAIKTDRENIITRRAAGEQADDDAERLALFEADLEGLAPLLKKAEAEAAQLETSEKRNRLSHLRELWEKQQALEKYDTLAKKISEIEDLLVRAVAELHQRGKAAGRGHHLSQSYRPSVNLSRLFNHGALPRD